MIIFILEMEKICPRRMKTPLPFVPLLRVAKLGSLGNGNRTEKVSHFGDKPGNIWGWCTGQPGTSGGLPMAGRLGPYLNCLIG